MAIRITSDDCSWIENDFLDVHGVILSYGVIIVSQEFFEITLRIQIRILF